MSREENIAVFQDTCQYFEKPFFAELIQESLKNQKIIYENEKVEVASEPRFQKKAVVRVSGEKSFESAMKYRGEKVCVHNFASFTNPGGGVTKGSSAQEESLYLVSTLYPLLSDKKMRNVFHERHRRMLRDGTVNASYNDDAIYTPGVMVFKDDNRMLLLPRDQWMKLDVITLPAPNLRPNPSNIWNPELSKLLTLTDDELFAIHKKRAKRLFEIAKVEKADVLILGAFGCGAFRNSPEVVARAYYEVVQEYRYDFKAIEFAVYCSKRDQKKNPTGNNYAVFQREYKKFRCEKMFDSARAFLSEED